MLTRPLSRLALLVSVGLLGIAATGSRAQSFGTASATRILSPGDSVQFDVRFTATGGTITAGGLYTASEVGVFRVIAQVPGGLTDTATIYVSAPPAYASSSSAAEPLVAIEVGAPALQVTCGATTPDYIKIDAGLPFIIAGSKRQIRVGGCYAGRAIKTAQLHGYASAGLLTREMRYESDQVPGLATIDVGSGQTLRAAATLVVVPNFFQVGWVVALLSLWKKRTSGAPRPFRNRLLPLPRHGPRRIAPRRS